MLQDSCKSMLFCHRVRPGWSPVPCRPQMGQEMVWPTQRDTIQRFGSLYSVGIGLHWKLNIHAAEIVQIKAGFPQSQTRWITSALSAPDGPGNGVAHPKTYHTAFWQPVLGGTMSALESCGNEPPMRDRIPANQCCFAIESDQGGHQCPCRPQMGQEKVCPTQRHTMQCVGTWQPVLGGTMPALETNNPCDRNKSNQYCFATESDQGGHQCPVGPRWARKWFGPPKDIPYSILAA